MLCVEKWEETPVLIHLIILNVTRKNKTTKLGRNVSFILFKIRKNDKIILSANRSRHHATLGHFLFLNRLQSNLNGASQDYQQFYLFSIIH